MKTKSLLLCASLLLGWCFWVGNASGPGARQGKDRTGGPISEGFCANCHSGGSFGTDVNITLLSDMDTISEYIPETAYTLRVTIVAEGAEGYGFQAVALDAANQGAGSYGAPGDGIKVSPVGGIDYAEHSTRSTSNTFEIEWTAPAAGAGPIGFYAAGNAVNGNSGTSGDLADTASLMIAEAVLSGITDLASEINMKVAPSPAVEFVKVSWSNEVAQVRDLRIISVSGKTLQKSVVSQEINSMEIMVSDYPTGVYFVQAISDKGIQTMRFLKQ